MTLELLDSFGAVIATGVPAANVDQVINNYVSTVGGTYFANVIAGNSPYTLVVTRDADFDTEVNSELSAAQHLSPSGIVLGALGAIGRVGNPYGIRNRAR